MQQYAEQALRHWQAFLPERYAQIPDPPAHFAEMGARAAAEIEQLSRQLAGPDQPGETYLQKVGRLNNARQRAEEIVLPHEVLLAPQGLTSYDPETDLDVLDSDPQEPQEEDLMPGERSSGWIPTTVDPSHPYWADVLEHQEPTDR